jgi:hypothetical protein
MKLRTINFLAIVFALSLTFSCDSPQPDDKTQKAAMPKITISEPKDDIDEFEKLVRLPYYPEDVTWRETTVENSPEGNGTKIRAILLFKKEEFEKLMALPDKQTSLGTIELEAENWFPDELVARSDFSGDRVLKGIVYPADSYFAAPYTKGRLLLLEGTDFFILEVSMF